MLLYLGFCAYLLFSIDQCTIGQTKLTKQFDPHSKPPDTSSKCVDMCWTYVWKCLTKIRKGQTNRWTSLASCDKVQRESEFQVKHVQTNLKHVKHKLSEQSETCLERFNEIGHGRKFIWKQSGHLQNEPTHCLRNVWGSQTEVINGRFDHTWIVY